MSKCACRVEITETITHSGQLAKGIIYYCSQHHPDRVKRLEEALRNKLYGCNHPCSSDLNCAYCKKAKELLTLKED